jgi:anthranilate synthase
MSRRKNNSNSNSNNTLLPGVLVFLLSMTLSHAFSPFLGWTRPSLKLKMSSSEVKTTSSNSAIPDYNGVPVAKTGGRGAVSASQHAFENNLSLGAPRARPSGGHYLTKGGIQVTANVHALQFSPDSKKEGSSAHAIEELVTKLDYSRGAILHSSYEFPGRYARWSLGFVDPPLEISGKGSKCRIRALNARGRLLLPAIQTAMNTLKEQGILEKVTTEYEATQGTGDAVKGMPTSIDVTVVPMSLVGSFSEEERSRQVNN